MELYIGTLTHNCLHYTQQLLGSFSSVHPHNFIIVDNGSSDRTRVLLDDLSHFTNQIHIRNRENRGVAAGWNQILRRALHDPECKYIYVLNNDLILNKNSCDVLLNFLKAHPEFIAVSSIESNRFKPEKGKVDDKALSFVAVMFTRKCVELVGLFDEQFYPAYFEDNDYYERLKREALPLGLKFGVVHDSTVVHIGSRTINEGGVFMGTAFQQNRERFRRKWGFTP